MPEEDDDETGAGHTEEAEILIGDTMDAREMKVHHRLPDPVASLLSRLSENGFEAYVVGGAVRDILLSETPLDYDVATSATPSEVMEVFGPEKCHPTGISHGTVTVVMGKEPVEVTTFRVDGEYADARHPDKAQYTRSLEEDVKRRDFTMNALAMRSDGTVIDYVGGIDDLHDRLLRTVGVPKERFEEDALRILRALRFSAEHGFRIEEETSREIFLQKDLLRLLSVERIWKEFSRTICGLYCAPILRKYFDVFSVFLPEIVPMRGFEQHNPHHIYDVWEHTLVAMMHTPPELVLRTAVMFHDVGKPPCYEMGEDGIGHFRGHPKVSAAMADEILKRLKVDTCTREMVVSLIRTHDVPLEPSFKSVRRRLAQYGEEKVRYLLKVKRADIAAHSSKSAYRLPELTEFEKLLDQVISEKQCCSYSAMAINGKDLIAMGMTPGTAIGKVKKQLLNEIIDGILPNEKEALKARAAALWKEVQELPEA